MSLSSVETIPALTSGLASRLAAIALSHVRREYPNKLDHLLSGPQDAHTPRALHSVFYGSFDWHSCVHSYWLLATLLRVRPGIPEAPAIRELFDDALTPQNIAGESAYLARPESAAFERPYGWAWLLALQAELMRQEKWHVAMQPLTDAFVQRFRDWLPRATYPVRAGTHGNTAFALRLTLDYAQTAKDDGFAELLRSTALRWYAQDADCQCWEPSGEDFLSPALTEAQCMGAALNPEQFRDWFARFLPHLADGKPACVFEPAYVSDRSDGRIVHLDGLNLSRAWAWAEIATLLEPADPLRDMAIDAARRHLFVALPSITGDYAGEHWLATYALLAVRAVTQYSRPNREISSMQKITPHLWFDRRSREAIALYSGAFENSRVVSSKILGNTPSGSVEVVVLELAGQTFQCLFAGPEFKFTPAVSFLVSCATMEEAQAFWTRFSEGGQVLMPFASYPFSDLYGWCQDRYGLSWQVMFVSGREIQQKITPMLMFIGANSGKAEEAMLYYTSLFPESAAGHLVRYGAGEIPEIEGTVKFGAFSLSNQNFVVMDSARAHGFAFNEAISFMVRCEDQREVDRFWAALSADPRAEQCGWLKDRYDLSWQIVPKAMDEMMQHGSPEQMARVTQAFLKMKKFDIATLQRAFNGK